MAEFQCPRCRRAIANASLAESITNCPSCGSSLGAPNNVLPPPIASSALPAIQVRRPNTVPRAASIRAATDWPQTIRRTMLVFTLLWIVGMLSFGIILFAATVNDPQLEWTGTYVFKRGVFLPKPTGEFYAETFVTSVIGGLVCPTIPYAITMILLAFALLASKK